MSIHQHLAKAEPSAADPPSKISQTLEVLTGDHAAYSTVGVVLGSGLGGFVDSLQVDAVFPYQSLPHFPCSTAPGHAGRLVLGRLDGRPLVVLQGRCHLYEGYSPAAVTYPVHVLHAMGVQNLILSCAAGGLAPDLHVGELLVIQSHLNLQFQNFSLSGSRPDRARRSEIYTPQLVQRLFALAQSLQIPVRKGTYIAVTGPNYETRAEVRWLREFGTAVGMSTIAEASVAAQLGLEVAAVATITNLCHPDAPEQTDSDHVVEAAARAEPQFRRLVAEFLRSGAASEPSGKMLS